MAAFSVGLQTYMKLCMTNPRTKSLEPTIPTPDRGKYLRHEIELYNLNKRY